MITLGCDPEVFVINPNHGGWVTAHGLLPGTKNEPFKVPKGAVQIDGMACEFNIDPASSATEWVTNIRTVWDRMQVMLDAHKLVIQPVAHFEPEYFDEVPEQAKELGCDPDFDAYTMAANERPDNTACWRSAGGHVHIGWLEGMDVYDPEHFKLCGAVARQMDYYLGIHSLLWDNNDQRRKMYGRAGAFRPKPYGMEYRTMSNMWLKTELLQRWVFTAAKKGIQDFLAGKVAEDQWGDMAQHIINSGSYDWPHSLDISIPGLPVPPTLKEAS